MSRNRDFHRNSLEVISDLRFSTFCFNVNTREGGTPLYKPYRHVPPQRVGCFRRFGLKTGIDFTHFGLESGMVFKGTTGLYERIYCFNSK